MFKRFGDEILSVILLLLAGGIALLVGLSMPAQNTTVSIGSGQVALVQTGSWVVGQAVNVAPTLPVPSTAGTLLVLMLTGTATSSAPPAPWVAGPTLNQGFGAVSFQTWLYPNNPGNIQTITIPVPSSGGTDGLLSEWSNVAFISALETSGTAGASSGTTLTISAGAATLNPGDIAIAGWAQALAANGAVTFTSPAGWTRLKDNGALASVNGHDDAEYLIGPTVGAPVNVTMTSSGTTGAANFAAGAVMVLKAANPVTDQSAYLEDGSLTLKQNTADFSLMLGGKLLLESVSVGASQDGLQLEDGSGVLVLDTYIPQLGDPVTFSQPSWSGRVVDVNAVDLMDRQTTYGYRRAVIAATNSSAAAGGIAPGDLSDVITGGFLQLEDGSGDLQLEDGSGNLLQEGTSFSYRQLSVRKTQNQDGTVTTYGTVTVYETGFAPGQTFKLTSQNLGYSAQQFTIQNVTQTFIGRQVPAYLLEFGDAYQTLQKAGGGVLTQQGSVAVVQQGAAVPAGTLGYAQVTANQTMITTEVDLTGLTVTVTVMSGRRIRLSGYAATHQDTNAAIHTFRIKEGSTELARDTQTIAAGVTDYSFASVILQPTAGVHTYKLTLTCSASTGSILPDANSPSFILCEDIGV